MQNEQNLKNNNTDNTDNTDNINDNLQIKTVEEIQAQVQKHNPELEKMLQNILQPNNGRVLPADFKCGLIAIVGRPNVGKSSLMNLLVGEKVSITSHKAQTTRHHIMGIANADDAQYVFVDTPGFQTKHQQALNKNLNKTMLSTLTGVDLIVFMIEAKGFKVEDQLVLDQLPTDTDLPIIILINKIDLVSQQQLMTFIGYLQNLYPFAEFIPFSVERASNQAQQGKHDNGLRVLDVFKKYLPTQPPIYSITQSSTQTERFRVSEFIREKVFRLTGDELPYQATVIIDQFENNKKILRVFATIIVEKSAHKAMVIGENGQKIKQISQLARMDIEKSFNKKVYLELWVKVKSGWADDQARLKAYGYQS